MADLVTSPLGEVVDTSPAQLPSKTMHLRGTHVTLTGTHSSHAAPLFKHLGGPSNAHLWTYMFTGPYATPASLAADLDAQASSTDPIFYTILLNETSEPVGRLSLMRIDAVNRVVEVGNIVFAASLQRTAAATEAIFLLGRHVFQDLGYRRWEWKCNDANAPSKRAALRFGFAFEGCFRQHMIQRGRNRDTAWFSMLDSEWEGRKREFEAWLDEGNFDEKGRQRKRLEDFREG